MKKEEKQLLVTEKINEGKTEKIAWNEVNRDIKFLKDLKERIKDEKQQLILEEKKLNLKSERFRKEYQKLLDREEKLKNQPIILNRKFKNANTRHLNRILQMIPEIPTSINQIKNICLMEYQQCKDGLNFLVKQNLIKNNREMYLKKRIERCI